MNDNIFTALSEGQQQQMLAALTAEKNIRLAKSKYYSYTKFTNYGFKDTRLHKYVCDQMQDFIDAPPVNALFDIGILTMPWQHGKSLSTSESLPAFTLGYMASKRDTPYKIIQTAYGDGLTQKFAEANKSKLLNYNEHLWPEIFRSKSQFNNDIMELKKLDGLREVTAGTLLCRPIMGAINGEPADLLIIDDPVKNPEEAASEAYRTKLISQFESLLKPRIKAGGKLLIVMTRQGHNDFIAYIQGKYGKFITHNIVLPLMAKENDPLGRAVGEPLCPEIGKGKEWVENLKETTSSMLLATQYQCDPGIEGGNIFKTEWWKHYTSLPVDIKDMPVVAMSVDATFKDNANSDYVSIQAWAKINKDYYFIDRINAQLDIIKTLSAIESFLDKYPIQKIFVEDKANGSAIVTFLQQKYSFVYPVNPLGGKLSRAHAAAPYVERGHCFLPEYASYTEAFKSQLANFPNDDHDDDVDAFTQMIANLSLEYAEYKYKSKTVSVKTITWTDDMYEDYYKCDDELIKREMLELWGIPEDIEGEEINDS